MGVFHEAFSAVFKSSSRERGFGTAIVAALLVAGCGDSRGGPIPYGVSDFGRPVLDLIRSRAARVTGLVALFTMGTFTLFGLVKLMEVSPAVQNASVETTSRASVPYNLTHQIH